jgi:hypothetical protein
MNGRIKKPATCPPAIGLFLFLNSGVWSKAQIQTSATPPGNKVITEEDCTVPKLGSTIPVSAIGEPASAVTLKDPLWTGAADVRDGHRRKPQLSDVLLSFVSEVRRRSGRRGSFLCMCCAVKE